MHDVTVRHARKLAAPKSGYRYDIEGLRAVAILLVAGYHIWGNGRVSGGVDVFFMISGFFVGGGLLRRIQTGEPFGLGAYVRKLGRRLLPPLVLTLAAVVVGTWLWLPRSQWSDVAGGVLASATYTENWRMALNGQAYAVADPLSSPVQHIWSLSVQGQLFVALPILLLVARALLIRCGLQEDRVKRSLAVGIAVMASASLMYAVIGVRDNQAFAYFDTFARAWEYLAGTLVAVLAMRWAPRAGLATVMGWVGVAAILATGVAVDGRGTFPGLAALLPIGGAALLIFSGVSSGAERKASPSRLLGWRPLAASGGYAYEFYLWHWVVLVFALAATGRESFGWLAGGAVLVVSGVMAWAGRMVVAWAMKPRSVQVASGRREGVLVPAAVGVLTLSLAVPAGWLTYRELNPWTGATDLDVSQHPGALTLLNGNQWPTPADVAFVPGILDAADDWPLENRDECEQTGIDDPDVKLCLMGDLTAPRTVALVGGSHSANFAPAIDVLAQEAGVRIEGYFKQGCPLAIWGENLDEELSQSCVSWNIEVLARIVHGDAVGVITTGTRPGFERDDWDDGDYVPGEYVAAWEYLAAHEIGVAALRDNPWFSQHARACVEEFGASADECAESRDDVLGSDVLTGAIDSEWFTAVDLSDSMCEEQLCRPVVGNVLAYIDESHLTATFSRTLAPSMQMGLENVPWWP